MTGYKALIHELHDLMEPFSYSRSLGARAAQAIESLLAERDDAMRQLSESRARFGDMEARVVELEAVIAEAKRQLHVDGERANWERCVAAEEVLSEAPSVVMADHDREVAARAWDEGNAAGYRDRSKWAQTPNPYRVADQNGEHA